MLKIFVVSGLFSFIFLACNRKKSPLHLYCIYVNMSSSI